MSGTASILRKAFVVALLVSLAACSGNDPDAVPAVDTTEADAAAVDTTEADAAAVDTTEADGAVSAGDLEKTQLKIANALDSATYLPSYVGVAGGFFEDQGLDVQLEVVGGAAVATSTLIAGEVDFASSSASTTMSASAEGAPLTIIGTQTGAVSSWVVIRTSLLEELGISEE